MTRVTEVLKDPDGTVKLRIALEDGAETECVLLQDRKGRKTACLSTQAGCAMGCAFCLTGSLGLRRNLRTEEIVEQFHHLGKEAGPASNIVFMGMGEPLMNTEELRKSIAIFTAPRGLSLALRRMTVSTCGVVPGIIDLADRGPFVGIALSLITAKEELRKRLMPAARLWGLGELREALGHHQEKTRKRITLEIVLLDGVNDRREDVEALKRFARGLEVIVNLIPWNPAGNLPFRAPGDGVIQMYYEELVRTGIPTVRRFGRGAGIGGACGQLGSLPPPGTPPPQETRP